MTVSTPERAAKTPARYLHLFRKIRNTEYLAVFELVLADLFMV